MYKKKGFFFTNELNIKEAERLLNNMISSTKKKNGFLKLIPLRKKL